MVEEPPHEDIALWSLERIEEAIESARESKDLLAAADRAWRFGSEPEERLSTFTLANREISWLVLFCQMTKQLLLAEKQRREE
ncbi:MAG: hypothetical protein WCT03_16070 [Candidatus Obscuribacterales bacterium]|jgi:hypothetical protein